ncbi:hypothetical protein [Aeromicrobium sp. CnD17-E]|uniref:hypothetical protein n=1 Tax=Aeromicrobium sp. CnD17-E TaxID=2954487 RepID=UPI0020977F59|nr:hypothetical protein [Aeromicrobium sp. CnD17-E]MCO7238407.1 hypothetical protein [Aeromicrobium sp. CnD17-E]
MSATSQVVVARALGLLTTALEASSQAAAVQAVRTAAVDLEAEQARRVAAYLAVQLVWRRMPQRSRAAMREWVEQEWVRVMQSPVVVSAGSIQQGGVDDGA